MKNSNMAFSALFHGLAHDAIRITFEDAYILAESTSSSCVRRIDCRLALDANLSGVPGCYGRVVYRINYR